MKEITSKENALVKEVKKLRDKKYRTKQKMFIVEGFRFVEEALKSDFEVVHLFIEEASIDKCDSYSVLDSIYEGSNVYKVSTTIIKILAETESPQGILAVVKMKDKEVNFDDGFYVLLDRLQDPGNVGTIIRSAHAGGAKGVILSGTVDLYNEKTLRATMGSVFNIPIIIDNDLSVFNLLKTNGFKAVGTSLDTDKNYYDINLKDKAIIVVGNEGKGISEELLNSCDELIKIPMPGGAESLNAAVAASIMIFEAVRQNQN